MGATQALGNHVSWKVYSIYTKYPSLLSSRDRLYRKMASDLAAILKQKAKEAIYVHSADLYDLSKKIWENPELCFKETYAHDQLTKFLADRGFDVTPHYTLDTAFRAESGEDGGLTIGLIIEYDALPEVGHACGHNLIAESGVAAALGKLSVLSFGNVLQQSRYQFRSKCIHKGIYLR